LSELALFVAYVVSHVVAVQVAMTTAEDGCRDWNGRLMLPLASTAAVTGARSAV
jgi:hypothetical protein